MAVEHDPDADHGVVACDAAVRDGPDTAGTLAVTGAGVGSVLLPATFDVLTGIALRALARRRRP
ncbi:hypothetical protein [Cellulomonas fengjieae]|uniref:Uncharacterized protein n=1 Tax=Cellulomonas fengjieae TaxID=2819978 RepID=A0ABS3SD61_9CELL|nr:hypothetical protein [Cellulomonas fengjieae]MBO3083688.1 hypothetical protein [Cellulomonas fengjieae]QVI65006.1 hypothetical protein KG102_12755 [Cellulomonas fengjieae]